MNERFGWTQLQKEKKKEQRGSKDVVWSFLHFDPDWNISATTGWLALKLWVIHGPQRMNPTDFGDSLSFSSSATSRLKFSLIQWNIQCYSTCWME